MKPTDAEAMIFVRVLALGFGTAALWWLVGNVLGSLANLEEFTFWPHYFFARLLHPLLGLFAAAVLWKLAPRLIPALTAPANR